MWLHMVTRAFAHRQSANNQLPKQRVGSALAMQSGCVTRNLKSECQFLLFASFVGRLEQIYLHSTITKAAASILMKLPVISPAPLPLHPSQGVVH